MKKGANTPIIFHPHIPKTAGTSFVQLLEENFGKRHYRHFDESLSSGHSFTVQELEGLVAKRRDVISFSSHNLRVFPQAICGHPALYVTFLRKPTETFLSLLKFVRRNFEDLSPETKASWPRNTAVKSIRELAAYQIAQLGTHATMCMQTRFFCHRNFVKAPVGYHTNGFGTNSFLLATEVLDRFFLVGIVEEFEESLAVLRAKLVQFGITFSFDKIPKMNTSQEYPGELDWLNADDEVGKAVLNCNRNDCRLYEQYKQKLHLERLRLVERRTFFRVHDWTSHSGKKPVVEQIEQASALEEVRETIQEFGSWEYQRINQRRLEHLADFGLPLERKKVWDVSAGIGDLTSFFTDRDCTVVLSEVRKASLNILQDRYSHLEAKRIDLDEPDLDFQREFDVVFCYGTLYHLKTPAAAIAFMAARCKGVLLLESCVRAGNAAEVSFINEDSSIPSQSYHGTGCRPTRRYIFDELKKHFPFAYVSATQPCHPEFPADWTKPRDAALSMRAIFVASREALNLVTLIPNLPDHQESL